MELAMTDSDSGVAYGTRANHFKGSVAMGGHLTLEGDGASALVFRAHGVFQRKYEHRIPVSHIRAAWVSPLAGPLSNSLDVVVANGATERFVIPAKTQWQSLLAEAIEQHAADGGANEDLAAKDNNRLVAIELARAGGMLGVMARQWLDAYDRDSSVPIFGVRPYWTPTGVGGAPQLLSLIGMRGLAERLEHVRGAEAGDPILAIMAEDPNPKVRAVARARLS